MELVPYSDDDLWLTRGLETDERVMAELGGPWPEERIPLIHERRMASVERGMWCYTLVPSPGDRAVGMLGIFDSEFEGQAISETGWSVLPEHQGKGYASAGLALLLERARADGRWGAIHAFPGATNGPSNALCRKFGFELVGQGTFDYSGRSLTCNHWVLDGAVAAGATDAKEHA